MRNLPPVPLVVIYSAATCKGSVRKFWMKGEATLFFLLTQGTARRSGTKEAGSLVDIFFFPNIFPLPEARRQHGSMSGFRRKTFWNMELTLFYMKHVLSKDTSFLTF